MSLSADTVWEVRTTGNDTNGGAFVTGASGTDYSQQDAKNTAGNNISTTDAVSNGSTTLTSATASFTSAIVGNIIYLQGGTGGIAIVRRQVTAFTNATTVTLDASVASSTGMTMNIGGCLASPGEAGRGVQAGNKIYIKAGTYTVTSTSTNVTNGCFSTGNDCLFEGYQTSRGDLGTAPVIIADGVITSFTLVNFSSASQYNCIRNLVINGNSRTSSRGLSCNYTYAFKVKALNCTNTGINLLNGSIAVNCWATGCSTQPAFAQSVSIAYACVAEGNTVTGFSHANSQTTGACVNCISYNNTGASSDGFSSAAFGIYFINCISYANGRDGFRLANGGNCCVNSVAEGNTASGAFGFNASSNNRAINLMNCAGFNNGAAGSSNVSLGTGAFCFSINFFTLTQTPFINAAGGDFSLNNKNGGGKDLRNAGFPGTLINGIVAYTTPGAAQFTQEGGLRMVGIGGLASGG
jgi:hypothetical protein